MEGGDITVSFGLVAYLHLDGKYLIQTYAFERMVPQRDNFLQVSLLNFFHFSPESFTLKPTGSIPLAPGKNSRPSHLRRKFCSLNSYNFKT